MAAQLGFSGFDRLELKGEAPALLSAPQMRISVCVTEAQARLHADWISSVASDSSGCRSPDVLFVFEERLGCDVCP